jgi:hypothetical protein
MLGEHGGHSSHFIFCSSVPLIIVSLTADLLCWLSALKFVSCLCYMFLGFVLLTCLAYSNARFRGTGAVKPGGTPGPNRSPTPSSGYPNSPTATPQGNQSSTSLAPKVPPLPNSPSLAQAIGVDENSGMMASGDDILNSYHLPRPLPAWLNPSYAKHIVKGNFMTLSARPKTVEQGEWIAHQSMY